MRLGGCPAASHGTTKGDGKAVSCTDESKTDSASTAVPTTRRCDGHWLRRRWSLWHGVSRERYIMVRAGNEDVRAPCHRRTRRNSTFQDPTACDYGGHLTQTRPTGRSNEIYGEYTSGTVVRCGAVPQRFRRPSRSIRLSPIQQHYIIYYSFAPCVFASSPSVARVVSSPVTLTCTSHSPSTVVPRRKLSDFASRVIVFVSSSRTKAPTILVRPRDRSRKFAKVTSNLNSYSLFILCTHFAISYPPPSSFIVFIVLFPSSFLILFGYFFFFLTLNFFLARLVFFSYLRIYKDISKGYTITVVNTNNTKFYHKKNQN